MDRNRYNQFLHRSPPIFAIDFVIDIAIEFTIDFARDFVTDFAIDFAIDLAIDHFHATNETDCNLVARVIGDGREEVASTIIDGCVEVPYHISRMILRSSFER